MKLEQILTIEPGLYLIARFDGSQSLAAIGRSFDYGVMWLAACDHQFSASLGAQTHWNDVESITPIVLKPPNDGIHIVGQDITIDGSKTIESARRST